MAGRQDSAAGDSIVFRKPFAVPAKQQQVANCCCIHYTTTICYLLLTRALWGDLTLKADKLLSPTESHTTLHRHMTGAAGWDVTPPPPNVASVSPHSVRRSRVACTSGCCCCCCCCCHHTHPSKSSAITRLVAAAGQQEVCRSERVGGREGKLQAQQQQQGSLLHTCHRRWYMRLAPHAPSWGIEGPTAGVLEPAACCGVLLEMHSEPESVEQFSELSNKFARHKTKEGSPHAPDQ